MYTNTFIVYKTDVLNKLIYLCLYNTYLTQICPKYAGKYIRR